MNPEKILSPDTGGAIDSYLEQYERVTKGDESPGALQKLKELYVRLERLWVLMQHGRKTEWKEAQPAVDQGLRGGAVILGKHGMIEPKIGGK